MRAPWRSGAPDLPAESSPPQARPGGADEAVRGERSTALVDAARSVQSRLGSVLAAGLMLVLGLAALTWYYTGALTRGARARQAAQTTATSRAQGEMPLPPLGHFEPAAVATAAVPGADPAPLPTPVRAPDLPLIAARAAAPAGDGADPQVIRSPGEIALDRRLSGGVLSRASDSEAGQPVPAAPGSGSAASKVSVQDFVSADTAGDARRAASHGEDALVDLLRAPVIPAVPAQLLPTQRFLLPQGNFIDCTLETAIDSTLPGMTTCVTATDTFGADGKVVLLERGTKLVGETRGQVQQGQARVFVLWTEARTPTGVVVPLASPGTDELGRAGLPGEVQRHFWQRFGAAMLISLIDGAVQAGVQAAARPGDTVIYAPQPASSDVLTEVLKDTVSIAPTVIKHNGDRIQVLVARDLDFRPVYELRTAVKSP